MLRRNRRSERRSPTGGHRSPLQTRRVVRKKRHDKVSAKEMAARRLANMGSFAGLHLNHAAEKRYVSVKDYAGEAYKALRKSLRAEAWSTVSGAVQLSVITAAVTLILFGLCAVFTDTGSTWYASLDNPSRNVPQAVFVIAWGVFFTLLGITYVLIAKDAPRRKIKEAAAFALSGLLGVLWTFLFFYRFLPANALLVAAALLTLIVFLGIRIYKTKPYAAWVLAPCTAWLLLIIAFSYYIAMFN